MKGHEHMKTKLTKLLYATAAVVTLATSAATANGARGDLFASINGSGQNGGGFIYQYQPNGLQRIVASGLSRPRGVAFGREGSLYVATNTYDGVTGTFQASIVKITARGVQNTVATLSGDLFAEKVVLDLAGDLFVVTTIGTIYKITPGGVASTFGSISSDQSLGLAFDSAGNLYMSVNIASEPPQIWKFTPDGTSSLFVTATRSDRIC
jgi:hypothetical protein